MLRPIVVPLVACVLTATTPSSLSDADRYLDQFIDRTVSPRDDFFHYAVGKWLREHPIPKSERSWGVADVIQEETYQRLLGISKAAASAKAAAGSNQQKIGDFWYAAMDTVTIARQGFAWLDSEFARIAAVTDLPSFATEVARLQYLIGWSLGWMNQIRAENLAVRVKTDVHAPSPFRVIGPVSNMVPFYEAYAVKPGDRMYRADSVRVQIW
jgi:predicted metalloendopeptidase